MLHILTNSNQHKQLIKTTKSQYNNINIRNSDIEN